MAIKGLENLQLSIKKMGQLKKAFANEMLKRVKDRTPVRTGILQESWSVEVKKDSIDMKNDATNEEGEFYVPFVEFGTAHMAGAFMLSTTILESQDILTVAKKNVGL
jgi:hypothetical protein